MGHLQKRLAARAKVVLAAIEAGDTIAYDLMARLAAELAAVEEHAEPSPEKARGEPAGGQGG